MTKVVLFLVAALAIVAGCKDECDAKSVGPLSVAKAALLELPCVAAPDKAELLDECEALALFVGETAEDAAFNKEEREIHPYPSCLRNSLFLRWRMTDGSYQWRVLLTTGSDWQPHDGMDKWCSGQADDLNHCFAVDKASFASDGRHLWLVCDPQTSTFHLVCSYDVYDRTFRVLIDGYTAIEEPDGTIRVEDKKISKTGNLLARHGTMYGYPPMERSSGKAKSSRKPLICSILTSAQPLRVEGDF